MNDVNLSLLNNDSIGTTEEKSDNNNNNNQEDIREYPREYDCPITQSLMNDPVTASDGHTYERSAIQYWIDTGHNTSPVTNESLDSQKLYTNHALRKMISARRIKLGEELVFACTNLSNNNNNKISNRTTYNAISAMIEKGADLNLRDNNGNTPVSICTKMGRIDLVELLITSNADVLKTNEIGDTALTIAKKRRLNDIYNLLEIATKEQQQKIEEENEARLERRRQREEVLNNDNNNNNGNDDNNNNNEQRFPTQVGNWRMDMGRGFFPSLFALQFQNIQPRNHDGRQPLEHYEQQVFLSRLIKGLGMFVLICLILF